MTGINLQCQPSPFMSGASQILRPEVILDEQGRVQQTEADLGIQTDTGVPPPP